MAEIRTGTPDVAPDTPAHTPGVAEGNAPGGYAKQAGHKKDGRSNARRSTGICPKDRGTVIPGSPNLSPP